MIPCALIGLGRIASLLEDDSRREKPASHAGAIAAHPEACIAGGMDTDPERRTEFGRRWNVDALYDDAGRMLEERKPQILHICTHADSHLDYLALGLDYRIPVIILEKPVSDSLFRAGRMLKKVEASGSRVLVNHERRYSADYRSAAELIAAERYGPLRSVNARLFMGLNRPLEAVLLYDATHLFDVVGFLLKAPVTRLRRHSVSRDGRTVFASAECGGVPLAVEVGSGRDHIVFELELSFERGRLRIGNGIYEEWASGESPWYDGMRSLIRTDAALDGPTGYFSGMFADAVAVLKQPERQPVSGYRDGVESLRLVQRIRRGLRIF